MVNELDKEIRDSLHKIYFALSTAYLFLEELEYLAGEYYNNED